MRFTPVVPPREFSVGSRRELTLRDCGRVELEPDEQVTFITATGTELDVCRKSWGYYPLPSLNRRLPAHGLRAVLVRGALGGTVFVLLVERGREDEFRAYLEEHSMRVITWLDTDEALARIEAGLGKEGP